MQVRFLTTINTKIVLTRRGHLENYALKAAAALTYPALFTISWDRLGNLSVGGNNVKISLFAFFASLVLLAASAKSRRAIVPSCAMWIVTLSMLVVSVVSSFFAEDKTTGLVSVLREIVGAIIPACAVLGLSADSRRFVEMLKGFVRGGLVACFFGFYQLASFYIGTPQFIKYVGVNRL
jgi:hypothetical protein